MSFRDEQENQKHGADNGKHHFTYQVQWKSVVPVNHVAWMDGRRGGWMNGLMNGCMVTNRKKVG